MKNIINILAALFASVFLQAQITYSPTVDSLINDITESGILTLTKELSGDTVTYVGGDQVVIESRYAYSPFNPISATWIKEHYEAMGLSTEVQSFDNDGENIIATITGSMFPEQEYIVGAHYDDMPSSGLAPGADDNASGVIGTLEAARLLKDQDLKYTVKFMVWDKEELGLYGSAYYAENAALNGDDIIGVYNMDMIGYDSDGDGMTTLATNVMSEQLADDYIFIRDMYNIPLSNNYSSATNSDHSSFWENGYPAIMVSENMNDFNNKYHTSGDDVYNMNIPYYRKQVQAVVATLATLSMDLNMEMIHEPVLSGPSEEPREAWLTINSNHVFVFGPQLPLLYYSTNGLNFNAVEPIQYQADTFYFEIPGHAFGTTVYYYLAAQNNAATMIGTLPEGGRGINPPGTIRPAEYFSYNVDNTFYLTNCSGTLPKPILDMQNTRDTIEVVDDWEIEDLNVSVDITHPVTEDVEIYLVSPEGDQIALSVAHGGLGDNYTGTIFDDEAEIPISDAQPPFTGRYIPDESLSLFDGMTTTGEWVMRVYDNSTAWEGSLNNWCLTFTYSKPVIVEEEISSGIVLKQNYPNPARDHTTIEIDLDKAQKIRLSAHNLMGQEVATLAHRHFQEGNHSIYWNLPKLPSGHYFFRFNTEKSVQVMPFIVLRQDD